jgi:hypothetical protein
MLTAVAYAGLAAWIAVGCARLADALLTGQVVFPQGVSPGGRHAAYLVLHSAGATDDGFVEFWIAPAGEAWRSGWRSFTLAQGEVASVTWRGDEELAIRLEGLVLLRDFQSVPDRTDGPAGAVRVRIWSR